MALGGVDVQDFLESILGGPRLQRGAPQNEAEADVMEEMETDPSLNVFERLRAPMGGRRRPEPVQPEYGDDDTDIVSDPQELIRMLLAGDIVPMRTSPHQQIDAMQRLQTPGVQRRSQGQKSIEEFSGGSKRNPMLDLMDVIMFPGGQKVY